MDMPPHGRRRRRRRRRRRSEVQWDVTISNDNQQ